MIPKVFVSHASEDKERFVLEFATKLRARGIDAWVDRWEMLPGDSLVDKIFEEGIKDAQAVIVVISENSIKKPWVKEELNASIVKRINTGSKLIPVIIDDCEVPECLHSTLWQSIKNIGSYDEDLDRIIMSIYGQSDKPPIGKSPEYVSTIIDNFPNLTKVDSIIFKISCEKAIENSNVYMIPSEIVFKEAVEYGVDEGSFSETLDILDRRGYIKATIVISGEIPFFNLTVYGLSEYIRFYIKDFSSITEQVCYHILNNNLSNIDIAVKLNKPSILVDHVFNILEQRGLVNFNKTVSGRFLLYKISPELKRMLNK